MSEPSSFLLKCQITQEDLHRYMASPIKPFDTYDDWDKITFELSDEDIGFARAAEGKQTWNWLNPQYPSDDIVYRFQHDSSTNTLVYCDMTLAENWRVFLPFIHVIRGIGPFLSPTGGYAIIHNYIYDPNQTQALVKFSNKSSQLVNVDQSTPEISSYVEDASIVFDDMILQSEKKHDLEEPYEVFNTFERYKP